MERDVLRECLIRDAQTIEMMKKGVWFGPPDISFFVERLEMYKQMLKELDDSE